MRLREVQPSHPLRSYDDARRQKPAFDDSARAPEENAPTVRARMFPEQRARRRDDGAPRERSVATGDSDVFAADERGLGGAGKLDERYAVHAELDLRIA
jgi:hypothetical protein